MTDPEGTFQALAKALEKKYGKSTRKSFKEEDRLTFSGDGIKVTLSILRLKTTLVSVLYESDAPIEPAL